MKHVRLFESWEETPNESGLNEGIKQEINSILSDQKSAMDTIMDLQGLEDKYDYELSPKDTELVSQAYNTVLNELTPKQLERFEKRGEYVELLKRYKTGNVKINDVLYILGVDKEYIHTYQDL